MHKYRGLIKASICGSYSRCHTSGAHEQSLAFISLIIGGLFGGGGGSRTPVRKA